mmetsp:Transcript_390/g.551  ORF Transcript_390/g.551 Transcript_390/m.551 type:complete len:270 (+) Transcript_390:48-857(+)
MKTVDSLNFFNRSYVKAAVHSGVRPDGRLGSDCREFEFSLVRGEGFSLAEVALADTRCIGLCGCNISVEAKVIVNLQSFGNVRIEQKKEIAFKVRELLTNAVDRDALVIVPGASAWTIRIDIFVLSDIGGNVLDSCILTGLAALRHARLQKPICVNTSVSSQVTTDHSSAAIPLLRSPICVSIAIFGAFLILDPSLEEELSADATVSVALDNFGRVVALSKFGVQSMHTDVLRICSLIVKERALFLHSLLDSYLSIENNSQIHSHLQQR